MGKIELTRQSVCMGDDCLAPNAGEVSFSYGEKLSSVMFKIGRYVPGMRESIWAVMCGATIVGHLVFITAEDFKVYLDVPDCDVASLQGKWFCKYHPFGSISKDAEKLPGNVRARCRDYLSMLRAVEKFS